MELYLDTADANAVRELSGPLTIAGVTTNPSIIARSGKTPTQVLAEMSEVLSPDQRMFMQVIGRDRWAIMDEARKICSLRDNMYVKIPVSEAGLEAIKEAKAEGLGVLATAIYTAEQGLMAAMNGADYLAPYVNRMENLGDGIGQVIDLLQMLDNYQLPAKVIAASFKNLGQVHALLTAGVPAMTIPVDIARAMVHNNSTSDAVYSFSDDWMSAFNSERFDLEPALIK